MVTILSLGFLLLIGSIWAVALLFQRSIEGIETRAREDLARAARVLIEPPAEGQPSPLAIYSDQVATLFAARIVQQLKTAAGGVASGVAKQEQAEALGSVAGRSPWLALLAGLLPKRFRNQILSSPQFTGQLSMLADGGNHQAQPSSVANRLKNQT